MPKSQFSIFFDDGGVINDNEVRAPQWRKLIAEYFMPKYGKTLEEWSEANALFLEREIKEWAEVLDNKQLIDMAKFLERYDISWLSDMFEHLNIPIPNPEDCLKITREAYAWIIPRVNSAYEGMNELVEKLASRFVLYTSSGGDNRTLRAYYKAQGIEKYFRTLYGSDLIGVFKSHPEYFDRLFKDSGVDPTSAIIIDDKEKVLDLVDGFGAKCILSNISGDAITTSKYPVYNNPQELLDIICEITGVTI
ncbi:MAG: HAD family hydrolase [Candidatus Kariarchaeaceae archaeon]|jgi:HAD superfamily hydrolase (TIGR01509 family)